MSKKLAFLSSPFGWDYQNVKWAVEYARRLQIEIGDEYILIVPHIMYPQFMDKSQEQQGIEACKALLSLCDLLIVCGNKKTKGMKAEIEQARKEGINITWEMEGEDDEI
jgi:hypothetical protein